ncbi:MAG: cupin domain-containing protein [Bacteroidota bacterium]
MEKIKHFLKASEVTAVKKTMGRNSKLMVSESEMGSKGFAAGMHLMEPGGQSTVHVHEKEQEAMYFYSGTGVCSVGDEEYEIVPESFLIAPIGVKHQIRNTGNEPLKFVWIYCPPLPEHYSQEAYHKGAKDQLKDQK